MKHNIVTFIALTTIVVSSVIFMETDFMWIVMGALGLLYLGITAYGSYQIQTNYFFTSIHKGKKKAVALTFDDGPDPEFTPQILDILKEKKVKATFFVIGKKAEKYPELLRRIDEEGHTIANHSYSHHVLIAFFSTARLTNDLARCNEVITAAIGKTPTLFRPPFGVTNPRYPKALRENGLDSIGWSLRSMDTQARNKYRLIDNIISKLRRSDIILLHDRLAVTTHALEDIIEHINSRRLGIEPLPAIINKDAYVKV
ncbi:polysaccharide deacetylase family protein [Dyadobacter psychrotolerans]|uniref:Polysaccharide deacetylase family protein n=1 Tax=Dyadobacter psychrotolerans TaxID=2541721 RepID=A0A4R5D9M5_9BACT|nr:polysaccharide deacetylase family protein [Dyadobacter psychrotolerans]TDE10279.1 polysaccharide deacetylase family protein [Dyadobacter psychrotolerans]